MICGTNHHQAVPTLVRRLINRTIQDGYSGMVVRLTIGKGIELGVSIGHGNIKLGNAMFGRNEIGTVWNW